MSKIKTEVHENAYRMLNPGCVVLVTVGNDRQDNVFSVTWNMPVRMEPGMVAILSGKRHFSYPFIESTGEFGINIPDTRLVEVVYRCGSVSGYQEKDKITHLGLTRQKAKKIKAPLIEEAIGNLECRVSQIIDLGASSLIIANILKAYADPVFFKDDRWDFSSGLELLHHLGTNHFCTSRNEIVVRG